MPPFVPGRRPPAALTRPLVYLTQHPDAWLVDCLASRGWNVWRAKSVADALNLVKANRLHAGIVDFDGFA
ncbi:VpsR-related response regulator, partial [Paraburkholderia sp. SIMBA_049]